MQSVTDIATRRPPRSFGVEFQCSLDECLLRPAVQSIKVTDANDRCGEESTFSATAGINRCEAKVVNPAITAKLSFRSVVCPTRVEVNGPDRISLDV